MEDLEVSVLVNKGREEARKKENELCARLAEEHGQEDLAGLIRDSVRW